MRISHFTFIAALTAASAHASTLTLTASADSVIRASSANAGTGELALVGDTNGSSDYLRGAFAFDLSAAAAPELVGATINSITLTLAVADKKDDNSGDVAVTLDLHQLSASFTNTGVTWTSRDGTNDWTAAGGDFGSALVSVAANAGLVNSSTTIDFTSAALTSAGASAVGGDLYLIAKLAEEGTIDRSIFRFGSSDHAFGSNHPTLTIDYTLASTSDPEISGFSYNPADGSSQLSIKEGVPGGRYKLVEAADLDFSTPDPVPLTSPAIVGTLDGNAVICDTEGNATVEFNLGTSKVATFIRAEESP